MVRSQEVIERLMGHRETKSIAGLCLPTSRIGPAEIVKVQRVDGNYRTCVRLRCTLPVWKQTVSIQRYPNSNPNLQ
jgi:hypothetical protein